MLICLMQLLLAILVHCHTFREPPSLNPMQPQISSSSRLLTIRSLTIGATVEAGLKMVIRRIQPLVIDLDNGRCQAQQSRVQVE